MNISLIEVYNLLVELGVVVNRKGKTLAVEGTSITFTSTKDGVVLNCDKGELIIPLLEDGKIDAETIVYRLVEVMYAETSDDNNKLVENVCKELNRREEGRKRPYKVRHYTIENLKYTKSVVIIPFDNCMVVNVFSGMIANRLLLHRLTLPNTGVDVTSHIIHALVKM